MRTLLIVSALVLLSGCFKTPTDPYFRPKPDEHAGLVYVYPPGHGGPIATPVPGLPGKRHDADTEE